MRASSPTVSVAEASAPSPKEVLTILYPYFCLGFWLFHPGILLPVNNRFHCVVFPLDIVNLRSHLVSHVMAELFYY